MQLTEEENAIYLQLIHTESGFKNRSVMDKVGEMEHSMLARLVITDYLYGLLLKYGIAENIPKVKFTERGHRLLTHHKQMKELLGIE